MVLKYYEHQRAAIEEVLPDNERFCLFWEMGTGKTIPMLVHIDNLIVQGEVSKALWVGPITAYAVVAKNIAKLPDVRQTRLNKALAVINYDKLSRKGSKTAEEIALTEWDCVVLDEAHKIARPTSNRTRYFVGRGNGLGMARHIKYRYLLTGSPINQSRYEDLWAYMRFLFDEDYMTYADFKHRYLKTRTYPPGTYNRIVCGYTKNIGELKEKVARHAQYVRTTECLDLPEVRPDEIIEVPWKNGKNEAGATTKDMYYEALQSYVDCLDMVMDNPLAKMTKLRQIASGHVKDDFGVTHRLKQNKTAYIVDLIESDNSKKVVFFEFKETKKLLCEELDKKKIKYYYLDGDQKQKDIWETFQKEDDDARVFVVQYQSGSESIDLWQAHTTIFAEPCLSYISMTQARSRTHRNGQRFSCSYYFICTEDSIDLDIYNKLCQHDDFSEKFYRDVARKKLEQLKG